MPDQAAAGGRSSSRANTSLQRRLRNQSIAGILLTLLVTGGIVSYQFYQAQRETELEHLRKDLHIRALVLSARLGELSSIARQVTSRSEIRQLLMRYNNGEIDLATLRTETSPRVEDALRLSPKVGGISRLDGRDNLVVTVGEWLPQVRWPPLPGDAELSFGIPAQQGGRRLLPIAAPILTADNRRIGTDLVFFDIDALTEIAAEMTSDLGFGGRLELVAATGQEVRIFNLDDPAPAMAIDENSQIAAHLRSGTGRQLHSFADAAGVEQILVHDLVPETGWQIVYTAPADAVLAPARGRLWYLLATMLILLVAGSVITVRLTRPTLGKILVNEAELQELDLRNRSLLAETLKSKRLLEDVLNHTNTVIFIKDLDGRYILVNQAYADERGLPMEEIIGRTDADFHPPETVEMFRENDLRALRAEDPIVVEESLEIDGQTHHFVTTKFPLKDLDNQVYALCGIAADITDMRRTEQLKIELEAAEAANRAKSAFLANMSHELRTPLHGILSFSEIGGKRADTAERGKLQSYFGNIEVSGKRLLALLNELLDLSKLEAGKLELDYDRCDLDRVIDECLEEQGPSIQEKGLRIRRSGNSTDPVIDCDRERIFQVVRNLLNNAIKFSPPEGAIDFELVDASGDPPMLELRVTDDGSGIDAADFEVIFDKFVQSRSTTSQGTGLGLSISREIVQLHAGSIHAENSGNRGATLVVRLPRKRPDASVNETPAA